MPRADSAQDPEDSAARSESGPDRTDAPDLNPYLENYLDHVYARLVGILPYSQRMEVRAELKEHLASLTEAGEAEGMSGSDALAAAIRQVGSPRRLAVEWKRQKRAAMTQAPPWPLKKSFAFAAGVFAGVSLLFLPVLIPPFLGYSDPARALGLGYADWWALLMPLVAGGVIGHTVRGRSYFAAFCAVSLTIAICAIPYLADFPSGVGMGYGGFSSLYELYSVLYGVYGLPLTFIGVALGRGMARFRDRLLLRPVGYGRMSVT